MLRSCPIYIYGRHRILDLLGPNLMLIQAKLAPFQAGAGRAVAAATFELVFQSGQPDISRVTFGRELSLTAIKEIAYER